MKIPQKGLAGGARGWRVPSRMRSIMPSILPNREFYYLLSLSLHYPQTEKLNNLEKKKKVHSQDLGLNHTFDTKSELP